MSKLKITDVVKYVEENIGDFHRARLENLSNLELNKILKRKNPYLFKAKNILTSESLVRTLLDAHLSSQEETIFGGLLEGLAIYVCKKVYNGKKSAAEGIDLEFERDGIGYIVSIKSGPNWGNSSQIKRMIDNFKQAKRVLQTNSSSKNIVAVNGCCYGKENGDRGYYYKYCGQAFWEFISGNKKLYIDIIDPLGHKAKEKNEEFIRAYSQLINKFTSDFSREYCIDGNINWTKLVELNSSVR